MVVCHMKSRWRQSETTIFGQSWAGARPAGMFKPNSINVKLTYVCVTIFLNLQAQHTSDFIASKSSSPDQMHLSIVNTSIVFVFVIRICHIYVLYIYARKDSRQQCAVV